VGALSDQGEYLRLMNQSCESDQGGNVPYRIGQWWEVECTPCGQQKPPHVEDVSVRSARRVGAEEDLSGYLLNNATPWEGTMDVLFDGKIQFTRNGGGYIPPPIFPTERPAFGFRVSPSTSKRMSETRKGITLV